MSKKQASSVIALLAAAIFLATSSVTAQENSVEKDAMTKEQRAEMREKMRTHHKQRKEERVIWCAHTSFALIGSGNLIKRTNQQ